MICRKIPYTCLAPRFFWNLLSCLMLGLLPLKGLAEMPVQPMMADSVIRTPVGEVGRMYVNRNNPRTTYSVQFTHSYEDPVVILSPLAYTDPSPAFPRILSVDSLGFTFQIGEFSYQDGLYSNTLVSYLVIESGVHTWRDGVKIAAGKVTLDEVWKRVALPDAFASPPAVFTQILSNNDPEPIITRIKEVSNRGFDLHIQKEEALYDFFHEPEEVAWVAIETHTYGGPEPFEIRSLDSIISDKHRKVVFDHGYSDDIIFFAGTQTFNGNNPGILRYYSLSSRSVNLFFQEEKSMDEETSHAYESVSYWAMNRPGTLWKNIVVSDTMSPCLSKGALTWEAWDHPEGKVSGLPFIYAADTTQYISSFSAPRDAGEQFTARISGFICPPQTGTYEFWLSGKDSAELLVSTDESRIQLQQVAYLPVATLPGQYDQVPEQKSQPVYLERGKSYYVEARMWAGVGEDHVSVGWRMPNGKVEAPIPGIRLSPLVEASSAKMVCSDKNIGENKQVQASSYSGNQHIPEFAVDGDLTTSWKSELSGDQWITLDLGGLTQVCAVRLTWNGPLPQSFRLEAAQTPGNWASLYASQGSITQAYELKNLNGRGRYLRLSIVPGNGPVELAEWEVQGTVNPPDGSNPYPPADPLIEGLEVDLYPVPFDDVLYLAVSHQTAQTASLIITDMAGRRLIHREGLDIQSLQVLNLSGFSRGMYLARIEAGGETQMVRLTKQ